MSEFHPGVVLLLLSGLLIFWMTPISAWWMLSGQQDRNAGIWFAGTAVYALAASVFVFGSGLPVFVRVSLNAWLALVSVLFLFESLRRELSAAAVPWRRYLGGSMLHLGLVGVLQWSNPFPSAAVGAHLLLLSALEVAVLVMTNRLRRRHNSRALWLILLVLVVFIVVNLARVGEIARLGRIAGLLDFTSLSNVALMVNYLSVVFYCYGYWGFVVEKNQASRRQADEAAQLARQAELLAEQERRLAEEALRERTAMMERMAAVGKLAQSGALSATIAHEVNQPLAAIQLNVSEALRRCTQAHAPVEVTHLLTRIEHDNQRAAQILKRVRALFSQQALQLQTSTLDDVVHAVLVLLSRQLQQEGVSVHPELAAQRAFSFSPGEMQHTVLNLVENAVEALRGQPWGQRQVWIKTWIEAGHALLSVSDNGPGIPTELASRIFDLQVSGRPTGMGVGLWLARYIVERHAGSVVWDAAYQPGARFVVSLPMSEHTPETGTSVA